MRPTRSLALLLCGILHLTQGSNLNPFHGMSLEDSFTHLYEKFLLFEKSVTSDLAQKIQGEIILEVRNAEKRILGEKNELETKIAETEAAFVSKQNELSTKLQELEERVSKQKEDILKTTSEMKEASKRSFEEASERFINGKNELLLANNQTLMEVRQLQSTTLETVDKINDLKTEMTSLSERGRTKTDMLQAEINETRDMAYSCLASQRNAEDAIWKNMSSSVEKLKMQVDESLTSQLENIQSNLTTQMGKLQSVLLTFIRDSDNVSYNASGLDESLQNISKVPGSVTQSDPSSHTLLFYAWIRGLERKRDSTSEAVREIQNVLANHSSEIGSLDTRLTRVQNRCSDPPYVEDGYPIHSGPDGRDHGSVVTYECRGNKILAGNKAMECRFGEWTGEIPQCVDAVCDPPCQNGGTCSKNHTCSCTTFFGGDRCLDAVCIPPCQNEGRCMENNICSCTLLFSGDRCQNDYPQCGLDLRNADVNGIAVGNSNDAPAWPWIAAVYIKDDRYSYAMIHCGGSVIHRRFILTSAQCMLDRFAGEVMSRDVTARLGLTHLEDLAHLQEHSVRAIYTHPRSRNRFDNDIALLELEKPIEYNLFIRPVCLPPKETPEGSEFYRAQSSAQAIGWGYDGEVRKFYVTKMKTELLKDIDLVIQTPDDCNKSLAGDMAADVFTDRMFCAAEVKSSTCGTDEGGPAMQSHVNEAGGRIWTQVGIISFRIGCAQKGEYGFFTHLQKLMPWVDATMEAALER